jgi:hypothetical protein
VVGPGLPRDGIRRAQVIAAVRLQHDAGDGQAVRIVERVIILPVAAPPPAAQTVGSWSVVRGADFEAHFIGTSDVARAKGWGSYGSRPEIILFRPFPMFGCAPTRGPAIEPTSITALAGLAEVALADAAAVPIETLVAAATAECVMLDLDRRRQLHAAARITAAMTKRDGHDGASRRAAWIAAL